MHSFVMPTAAAVTTTIFSCCLSGPVAYCFGISSMSGLVSKGELSGMSFQPPIQQHQSTGVLLAVYASNMPPTYTALKYLVFVYFLCYFFLYSYKYIAIEVAC